MPDFYAGYDAVIKMDDTTGILQTFTGYVSDVDVSYEQDIHGTPVLGTKGKRKVAGQDDATVSIEGPWHANISTWVGAPSTWGVRRSLEIYPIGLESGEPNQKFEVFIKSFGITPSVDDAIRYSLEVEKDGDATWANNA